MKNSETINKNYLKNDWLHRRGADRCTSCSLGHEQRLAAVEVPSVQL